MCIVILFFLRYALAFPTNIITHYNHNSFSKTTYHHPLRNIQSNNNCFCFPIKATTTTSTTVNDEKLNDLDITWKIKPEEGTSRIKCVLLKIAANGIRLDCYLRGQERPKILCPKGPTCTLEAYMKTTGGGGIRGIFKRSKKVGRFGITTNKGPVCPEINESIQDIYAINPNITNDISIGAIKYMFVEPEYRSKYDIGKVALAIISGIHAYQGCDFTILVADDNGSGKLIKWYEDLGGFTLAPKLQNIFGSPNGIYGHTMISPTNLNTDFFNDIPVIWW